MFLRSIRHLNPKPRVRQRRSGWTLVEMMIATCAGMFILASVLSVYVFMRRTLDATANYQQLDSQSRNALDRMTMDIRQCGHLISFDATHLVFTNLDGSLLQYTYDTNGQTLSYTNASSISPGSGTLLSNLVTWQASEFIRIPSSNTAMDFFPITSNNPAISTKVIVLNWACRKTNYLTLTDSECVQTTKIVLRN